MNGDRSEEEIAVPNEVEQGVRGTGTARPRPVVMREPIANQIKSLLMDVGAMNDRVGALSGHVEDDAVGKPLREAKAKMTEARRLIAEALGNAVL